MGFNMKKTTIITGYLSMIILYLLLLITTNKLFERVEYFLLFLSTYLLFGSFLKLDERSTSYSYNQLFLGTSLVYLIYIVFFRGSFFFNLTTYFIVAAIIGLVLTYSEKSLRTGTAKQVDKLDDRLSTREISKHPINAENNISSAKKIIFLEVESVDS